ncbi:MAG: OmpA family protein [Candidatus Acidoferrum typicum]|nr:OmpA family protein [Candidatus Acidoferrum typicum]
MNRAISFLFSAALMTTGLLPVAVGQQPATPESEIVEPQPILWVDHSAIEGLNDVHFDFDTYHFVSDPEALQIDAQWLKDHPDVQINLAGYADTRGDVVYNVALSQERANTVKQKLLQLGIPEDRIVFATGWGKLYQSCLDPSEECWKRNRRVQFEYANPLAKAPTAGSR